MACQVVVGFMPADDHSVVSAILTITLQDGTKLDPYGLTGRGSTAACLSAKSLFLPLNRGLDSGVGYPALGDIPGDMANCLYEDFGDPGKTLLVNCFYSTSGLFSYFNQDQSIYNAASGSTTLNVQLGSLNFTNGMQITVGTNPQVGPTSSNSSGAAASAASAVRFDASSILVHLAAAR